MRQITQPGPADPLRIESHAAPLVEGKIALQPGMVLLEAVAERLENLGLRSAALDLSGLTLGPLAFVMPAESASDEHVAFYSETFRRAGPIRVLEGTATYGNREAAPFLHGHIFWQDDDGRQSGGHLLPDNTRIAGAGSIGFKGCRDIAMATAFDPETNFTLFAPVAAEGAAETAGRAGKGNLIVARIRPNEDLIEALETICRRHGVGQARLASLIGSLVGARFEDGARIERIPTEICGRHGTVARRADGGYNIDLELSLIDVDGEIHRGRPCRGDNPVLICAEVFLERC